MRCVEGRYSPNRIPVTSNVTNIPARLKELSRDFFVMFNTMEQKYEIHDAAQLGTTLACVLPYNELDARAIEYVRKYSSVRALALAAEIEEYNEKLDKREKASLIDKANYKCREALNYLNNTTKTESIPKEVIEE